jgi:Domain of unknown function (DUF4037)
MKGLELAEEYYEAYGRPMVAEHFGAYQDRIAVGLVGEGSECFGFDDELSQDHDWGPGFCAWLTSSDYAEIGTDLQARYDALPKSHRGLHRRVEGPHAGKRTGVFAIKDFYRRFIRYDHVPGSLAEWRSLPETYLATATNGRVFTDPLGEFTAFRNGLLAFYPEDVRLKKLAARCATAGQTGQYNYKRSVDRGELVAAHCALSAFMEATASIVYLLNKRYRPFYKWMHRGMKELPVLGAPCHRLLADLCAEAGQAGPQAFLSREQVIEEISALIVAHLTVEGLSDCDSDFLLDHAHAVQAGIEDQALRNLHVMME